MDALETHIAGSPYARDLGVALQSAGDAEVRLALPFREENTNPGGVLHGGVAASLCALGGQAVALAGLPDASGPWHTAALQVNYLSAAREEAVVAEARLLRRGKTLCFAEVDVRTEAGKSIAHATATLHDRRAAEAVVLATHPGDDGGADPGPLGRHIGLTPFMGRRGIRVEHMQAGRSRLVLPRADHNASTAGGVHEGALLALLDTTGAMAAWAETGPGRFKASTPSMQARILAPPPADDLIAYGRVGQRDGDVFFTEVEVAAAGSAAVVARGNVLYRIVT